jgi:dienelactone hydrolase
MDSTLTTRLALRALAALCALGAAVPAFALNHEIVVNPLARGPFAVACSNVEHDMARLAALGGTAVDYWEGNEVRGENRYITDILAHRDTAFVYDVRVPFKPSLYPTLALRQPEFAAIVCHPTPRTNPDPSYTLPDNGGVVPHMQPAGAAPKLISATEYAQTLGIQVSPIPPPGPAILPTIVYSHGLGGSPLGQGYLDIAVELASQGYMVAAVFHADARFSPIRIENIGDLAYALVAFPVIVQMQALRPLALKAMTDRLLSHPGYAPGIDTSRIGGFGASLGGEAMALLMGARITSSLALSCEETERDPRIRAAATYVPYSGQSFLPAFCNDQAGAEGVDRPFLAIAGTLDTTAPIKMTEQAVNRMGSSRFLVELVGGQHELRPQDAGDVLTWMVAFLGAYLDVPSDPGAMARFIRMRQVNGGREDNIIVDVHEPFANVAGETRALEFHNTLLDHFFIAAGQDEIDSILAGGAGAGWELTGESFKVWPRMPPDTFTAVGPVCRFYGRPAGGPNSHFFTASTSECEGVKQQGGWAYEGIGFYIRPVNADGKCPDGFLSVNRAYNRGAVRNDSNHRFTTSDSTIREMGRKGWGVEGTVMCARP